MSARPDHGNAESDAVMPDKTAAVRRIMNHMTPATTRASTPDNTSLSMAESVLRQRTPVTYQDTALVGVREDEELGRRWGMKPGSAHQLKLKLVGYLVDVIRFRRAKGATESLAAYLRPIEDALDHAPRPVADPELEAALADAAEDVEEARYRANPCEQTARVLLRKRALERRTSLDHDRKIAAKYGIRL